MADLKQIADNLIKGKAPEVKQLVQKAIDEGEDVEKVLNEGLVAGMNVVGAKFKANEFYVPEVLIAAQAMKGGMGILRPILVGLSALLTTTMPSMKDIVKAVGDSGLKDKVRVMIEGAPLTQSYADEIGADGYAPDAAIAVDKAKGLLGVS